MKTSDQMSFSTFLLNLLVIFLCHIILLMVWTFGHKKKIGRIKILPEDAEYLILNTNTGAFKKGIQIKGQ